MNTVRRPVAPPIPPWRTVARRRVGGSALFALLLLAACAKVDDQAGQITDDDQRQLNEAAAMLDANSMDANQLPPDSESDR